MSLMKRCWYSAPTILSVSTSSIKITPSCRATSTAVSLNSEDMREFRADLAKAKRILILTGAGVSAESGVPTFRGPGGFWGGRGVMELATLDAFKRNPGIVWMFYAYRQQMARMLAPNPAHNAIAELQREWKLKGRHVAVVTQNIDGLHQRAGADDVIELHGSMFRTQCMRCGVQEECDSPIVPALQNARMPEPYEDITIKVKDLPLCKECKFYPNGILRPAVVWFGEQLDEAVMQRVSMECDACDMCLIVGTSSQVAPASLFAPHIAQRGMPVAEFNTEKTAMSYFFKYHFEGPAGETLPVALRVPVNDAESRGETTTEKKLSAT